LGEASLVGMLGCVRGDQDQAHVYDVPLLKGIGKHTLEAARQRHRATVQLFDDLVNLRVEGRDGDIVYVRIKMLTRLGELMDTYCVGRNLQRKGMLFLFDGRRLFRNQTPWELGMKDDDIIDAQEPINLRVKGIDGYIVHFKIKMQVALGKLMDLYCERRNLQKDE